MKKFSFFFLKFPLWPSRDDRSSWFLGAPFKQYESSIRFFHNPLHRMLLEADADINQVTSNGSCLHEAALYGKTDVVNMLLDVSKSVIAICLNMFPGHRGRE